MSVISTPITELFGIQHPILLAGMSLCMPVLWLWSPEYQCQCQCRIPNGSPPGMNVASGPELAAAVTNAGGLGVMGGMSYNPNVLRQQV